MEISTHCGFTEWHKNPWFYNKTNKKYYWEKCRPHLPSKHEVELIGDINEVKAYLDITEKMLSNIYIFAFSNHMESELEYILRESEIYRKELQSLITDFNDVSNKLELHKISNQILKAKTFKQIVEESEIYHEYLYIKEITTIRQNESNKSTFLEAVGIKAQQIADKNIQKFTEKNRLFIESIKKEYEIKAEKLATEYKVKYENLENEANLKIENMKIALEKELKDHTLKNEHTIKIINKEMEHTVLSKFILFISYTNSFFIWWFYQIINKN